LSTKEVSEHNEDAKITYMKQRSRRQNLLWLRIWFGP